MRSPLRTVQSGTAKWPVRLVMPWHDQVAGYFLMQFGSEFRLGASSYAKRFFTRVP